MCTKVQANRIKDLGNSNANAALKIHSLPEEMQRRLTTKYGGSPPGTWFDALSHLEMLADGSKAKLWELVNSHPIVEYVHVQCQYCGNKIPDDGSAITSDDEAIGLSIAEPTEEENALICGGWFRGPRTAKVFVLKCQLCGEVSRWFRSQRPEVILNPRRWGRLCGEQQTLQSWLADYFAIETRIALPLDWDHIWVECRYGEDEAWHVLDNSARNFASRLDEGIGAWTHVLTFGDKVDFCGEVTSEYLSCASDSDLKGGQDMEVRNNGRADPHLILQMPHWRSLVLSAREDASGQSAQAKTVNGHVLYIAGFTDLQISSIIKQAVLDCGESKWWDVSRSRSVFAEHIL